MKDLKVKTIKELNVNSLTRNPNHPRKEVGDLTKLTLSIRHEGILTPPVVAKVGENTYQPIDGDRRLEVAKALGYESLTCVVYEGLTEAEIAQKSYILNVERNQLNNIERALHIKKMKDEFGYSHDELEILGYGSKGQTSKLLSLLDLPEEIQGNLINGKLTKAHCIELSKIKDTKQMLRTAKLAIENDWSSKKVGNTVERLKRTTNKAAKKEIPANVPAQGVPGVYFKDAKDMAELPKESVGLVLTSPPYFNGMEYELGFTYDEHLENVKGVLAESARVLVKGGILALNVADITNFKGKNGTDNRSRIQPMLHFYNLCLRKHGFHLQDEIIWVKDSNSFTQDDAVNYTDKTVHTQYRIVNRHEPIYIFKKKGDRPIPSDENIILQSRISKEEWKVYAPSAWQISPAPRNQGHPNAFPDELARRIIRMYSFVGDTVLDPFLGSGTTVKVARELDRDGVGYERDLRYKAAIMRKLGVAEVEERQEPVSDFAARQLEELEAKQPGKPKVEIMASKGMMEAVSEMRKEKEMTAA